MATLRFDGRVAIVTGGGRGIGRSHALTLAERGASVVVNDVGRSVQGDGTDSGPANEVVEEIRAAGGAAVANTDDVSTVDGAEAIVESAVDNFGRIDIVVNNAGIGSAAQFSDDNLDHLMKHVAVHLVGCFNVSQAAWRHMMDNSYGRIVMTTSSALLGNAEAASYAAAKAGVIGLMRCLALGGHDHGIRVNAIAPVAQTRLSLAAVSSPDRTPPPGATPQGGNVTTLPDGSTVPVDPRNTSAVVAVLSHETCPVNGEILDAGAGHAGRLFIAATVGYHQPDTLTPEDVIEHWDQVVDETNYYVPTTTSDHTNLLRNPHLLTQTQA